MERLVDKYKKSRYSLRNNGNMIMYKRLTSLESFQLFFDGVRLQIEC